MMKCWWSDSALYSKFHFYDCIPQLRLCFLHCGNHRALNVRRTAIWFQYWMKLTYQRRHRVLMVTLDRGGIYRQQQVNSKDPRQSRSVIRSIKWEAVKGAPCDSRGGKAWGVSCTSCRILTQMYNHGVFMPPLKFTVIGLESVCSARWDSSLWGGARRGEACRDPPKCKTHSVSQLDDTCWHHPALLKLE